MSLKSISMIFFGAVFFSSGVASAALIDSSCKSAFVRFQTRFSFENFKEKFKNLSSAVSERDLLRNWLTVKVPSSLQDAKFFEVLNSEGLWERDGWSLQILLYEDQVDGKTRELYGFQLEHPDRDYLEHRRWVVDAVLTELEGRDTNFSIKLRSIETIDEVMKRPQFTVPSFVAQLIKLGNASSGFLPLHTDYLSLSPKKIDRFIEALEDPDRELPIIYVSKTTHNEWLISPTELSKRFLGRAIVMVESLNDETQRFNLVDHLKEKMPKELLAFGGAIRIYRPRVKVEKADDRVRHPFIAPDVISSLPSREVMNLLEAQLSRAGSSFNPDRIESVGDIENLKRESLLADFDENNPQQVAELLAKNESLQQQNQAILAENSGLRKELEGADNVLDELQEEHLAVVSDLRRELDELKALISQQWRGERLSDSSSSVSEIAPAISLGESLESLEAKLSDRVIFSSNAHTTALRNFENREDLIPVIKKIIQALSDHLWPILFPDLREPLRGTPSEIFKRESGFEIAFKESQQTRNMSNFESSRLVTHNSTSYLGEAHVKWRKGSDFIRIHFDHDPDLRKIIITHIVDHLPISSSSKNGKRR